MDYRGLEIVIEYRKGDFKQKEGTSMPDMGWYFYADYGYIVGTKSMEPGEDLDVYVGEFDSSTAYFIPILMDEVTIHEIKCLLGFASMEDAKDLMRAQYPFPIGEVYSMSVEDLKEEVKNGQWAAHLDKMINQEEPTLEMEIDFED